MANFNLQPVFEIFPEQEELNDFLQTTTESLQLFKSDYKKFLKANDLENLRMQNHSLKPTLQMLEYQKLLDTINLGKELLIQEETDQQKINQVISDVEKLCDEFIQSIQIYIK